ncbi:class I SAM-dependent methyltransferase [Leptospira levettii]|uniref:Class I SAM-dependent methyltransferase n=1 Tax=Leptospira levettii TaxID=2023178 RepID=A0AAW5VBQ1_9LEPT|nr:class I SAM-dependent methyltransferase [Leptospira levettii]MCW7466196.1 class I SAM-dependent methyltransferase [Leptospira levettii]MCW7512279.1 class I SAM-dependent methyltransferase [Leptospira levettii]MCW7516287.1 class I SAM-dependent methyltransferase [Leptospira levettii]
MNLQSCYLCGSSSFLNRPGKVRDNENLVIKECHSCGLVFLSSFDHIKNTHYQDSGMHGESLPEIREWLNETEKDDERRFQFLKEKMVNRKVLDFGCGVGGFLIKTKNITEIAEGVELETRLQSHFNKNEITVYTDLEELIKNQITYDVITAFHVIEHIPDPISIIESLSKLLTKGGELIIEVPSSSDVLLTLYENRQFSEFTYWSQHLFLFNTNTFETLIKKTNLQLNWIKHIQRYPLSNHLYWLAKGKPGGHKVWNHLNSAALDQAYEAVLATNGLTDTILVSVSLKKGNS